MNRDEKGRLLPGHKLSAPEAIRKANKGNDYAKGHKLTKSHKKKISKANEGNEYNLGRIQSEAHKKAISEGQKKRWIKIKQSKNGSRNRHTVWREPMQD